jgi:carbamoyltransferase
MTAILGISAFYHDSASTLMIDGGVVAAAQDERFPRKKSRQKRDNWFPQHAVDSCVEAAGISPEELDDVGSCDKPVRKFERRLA